MEEASKGGIRSGEVRRERKALRESLIAALSAETAPNQTAQQEMCTKLVQQAILGNTRAFEIIRDTIGEKPVERIANVAPDPDVIAYVEKALFGE